MTTNITLDEAMDLVSRVQDYGDELEEAIFETAAIARGLTFAGIKALVCMLAIAQRGHAAQYVLFEWVRCEHESGDLSNHDRLFVAGVIGDMSYVIDPRTNEPIDWAPYLIFDPED